MQRQDLEKASGSDTASMVGRARNPADGDVIPNKHVTDSGLQSQMSLDASRNKAGGGLQDPTVKELLATCAKYNLDQGVTGTEGGHSAEILEEIRHAEAMETIRGTTQRQMSSTPHSPTKQNGDAADDDDDGGEGPCSPQPLPKPQFTPSDQVRVRLSFINSQISLILNEAFLV